MNTYLITGATGYIGSMLISYIMEQEKNVNIIALVRNKDKAKNMLPADVKIVAADLTDRAAMNELRVECDYIIHCASVTKSAEMVNHPVEVTESIVNVTQNVLELAKRCHVKGMVYLSSMEVYGNIKCEDGNRASEDDAFRGTVDLLCLRSCYPLGKRMAENLCYSYYKEYGVRVKIARLAQTFGRGILVSDTRVFAQFAKAAREGRDIVLHTEGKSMGNYCGIDDALAGIKIILERGKDGEAYNVVNESNTMTILQMAELVANKIAGGKIKVVFDIPSDNLYGYGADTGLVLSGKKLMELGWTPSQSMEDMYNTMIISSSQAENQINT